MYYEEGKAILGLEYNQGKTCHKLKKKIKINSLISPRISEYFALVDSFSIHASQIPQLKLWI